MVETASRGTTITLYINEESSEFLDNYKVRSVIEKYCSFMPVEIFFEDECAEKKDEENAINTDLFQPAYTVNSHKKKLTAVEGLVSGVVERVQK